MEYIDHVFARWSIGGIMQKCITGISSIDSANSNWRAQTCLVGGTPIYEAKGERSHGGMIFLQEGQGDKDSDSSLDFRTPSPWVFLWIQFWFIEWFPFNGHRLVRHCVSLLTTVAWPRANATHSCRFFIIIFLEFPVRSVVVERWGMRAFGVELQFYILTTPPLVLIARRRRRYPVLIDPPSIWPQSHPAVGWLISNTHFPFTHPWQWIIRQQFQGIRRVRWKPVRPGNGFRAGHREDQ